MEELNRKRPVWLALSEFYLDTDLDDKDLTRIAGIFKSSGFTMPELKRINFEEVAPVLSRNLFSVAGVWSGFDPNWLEEEIKKRLNKRNRIFFHKIYKKHIDKVFEKYWKVIEGKINVA